jgi:hypothetical protein
VSHIHTSETLATFQTRIEESLLSGLVVQVNDNHDPVSVQQLPAPWELVGVGNYAVVVAHPDWPHWVVKVYAAVGAGLQEEAEVYAALGSHRAYSACLAAGERYLILRRLHGLTLYDCVLRGMRVEKQVIIDVDAALAYARSRGLFPHDVHGKNVLMHEGRGYVVDVSDFYIQERCDMWEDLKRAYEMIYKRTLYIWPIPMPSWVMNGVRKMYRWSRRWR